MLPLHVQHLFYWQCLHLVLQVNSRGHWLKGLRLMWHPLHVVQLIFKSLFLFVLFVHFSSVAPDEWEDFSNKNILKAEREKNSAINLRSIIDGILMQTLSDLQAQCQAVNLAFQKRIEETVEAKTKLEQHLAKVNYRLHSYM